MKIKIIELLKNIRKNFINFISISIFIFLGVTLFEGLKFSGTAIKHSIAETYIRTNGHDVRLKEGALLTKDGINDFLSIDDVDEAEGFFFVSDDFEYKGKSYSAGITSLSENISKCNVVEGTLPSADNEIAIFTESKKRVGNIPEKDNLIFARLLALSECEVSFETLT